MPLRPFRLFQFPWRSRAAIAREVDAELEFHIDARMNVLRAEGHSAGEARRRAREEFGDLEFTRRYCRDLDERSERKTRLADRVAEWRQDVGYTMRALRLSPGFAAVSILTLALAIGANTAIFSVARAVLLKPLPFGKPSELVAMYETPAQNPADHFELSPPNLVDYRARQRSLTGIGAYMWRIATWQPANASPEILTGMEVTANLFDLLGVGAWRGRAFVVGDDARSAGAKVILSYGFWRRALGGDAGIVGRTITLNNQPYAVVGIMPRGFAVFGPEDLWIPLDQTDYLARPAITRKQRFFRAIARLKPGVSVEAARADILAIAQRLQTEYPEADAQYLATLVPLHETMTADLRQPVLLLLAAAAFVLLIACANLANVGLPRAISRRAEIAVRATLGAGRARLARQLLTESMVIALIGGALGVVLAIGATHALLALNPNTLPAMFKVGIDGRVLAFSLVLSVGTGLLFGLVPALGATRTDLHSSLGGPDPPLDTVGGPSNAPR